MCMHINSKNHHLLMSGKFGYICIQYMANNVAIILGDEALF